MHHYRESLEIGETSMSQGEVIKLIEQLKEEWPGSDYDLLRHNCCVFSSHFCERLGVGPAPGWVTNLAAGATVQDGALKAATAAQKAAIIAAAKAGEIDKKYNIQGTCEAKAKEFLLAAQGLDQQYHIKENVEKYGKNAAEMAKAKAQELLTKAKDLDKQYHIQEKAKEAVGKAGETVKEAASSAQQKAKEKGGNGSSGCPTC